MMRRSAIRAGTVDAFNFGQPSLSKEFGRINRSQVQPGSSVDKGVVHSKLANGVNIITHEMQGAQSTVAAYVRAGPKYDPASAPGLSYAMRWALQTSNMENSLFQIDRNVRARGVAQTQGEIRKEFITVRADARRDMWNVPLEDILTSLVVPRFADSDLERFRDTWDNLKEEQRWQYPREYVQQEVEQVAFWKEALGNPREVPPASNDDCNHDALLKQWTQLFQPKNVTIAGVNVDHSELIAAYENAPYAHSADAPHFRDAEPAALLDTLKEGAQYRPGSENHFYEKRSAVMGTNPDMHKEAIVALAFKSFGRANLKEWASAMTVQALLDANYTDGLRYNKFENDRGVRTFYNPFNSTGLLGVTIRAAPEDLVSQTIAQAKAVQGLATDNIESAKARATINFLNSEVELQREYCDFLGTNFTSNGKPIAVAEYTDALKSVTAADVKKAKDALLAQRPSLYATGDLLSMPSLRQMGL